MVPALHLNFAQWERVAGLMGGTLLGARCPRLYTVFLREKPRGSPVIER